LYSQLEKNTGIAVVFVFIFYAMRNAILVKRGARETLNESLVQVFLPATALTRA